MGPDPASVEEFRAMPPTSHALFPNSPLVPKSPLLVKKKGKGPLHLAYKPRKVMDFKSKGDIKQISP